MRVMGQGSRVRWVMGQREAEAHGAEYRRPLEFPQRRRLEYSALDQLELAHWTHIHVIDTRTSLEYITLVNSAFAAQRRAAVPAAAPLLLGAGASRCRSISPVNAAGNQQQTRRTPLLLSNDDTEIDGRTDGRTPDRYIYPNPHTMHRVK